MTTKGAQAIAELVWLAEMSATCCRDLVERNEKLRAELEAANARIAELERLKAKNQKMREWLRFKINYGLIPEDEETEELLA